MRKGIVNLITTLFGLILIPVGVISIFILEKVNWYDFMWATVASLILIYIKNSDTISNIVNNYIDKKNK